MDVSPHEQPSNHPAKVVWIVAVLLVVAAWAGAYALRGSGEKEVIPGWADGMPAGLAVAKQVDKPMVVVFTAGWCPPCQSLKRNVLTKDEVHNALMAGYVPVQIDLTDQSSSNPNMAVARDYGIQYLPTVVMTTPEGEVIETYRGASDDLSAFKAWLTRLAE